MPDTTQGTYVDIYLLPVPQANLDAYRHQATAFGAVAKEHGALSYREFVGWARCWPTPASRRSCSASRRRT